MKTAIYILENLGCAHCAGKMEERIGKLPGVESVSITYATKQLRVTAENPDALLSEIRSICTSIESQVLVIPRKSAQSRTTADKKEEVSAAAASEKREHNDLREMIAGAVIFAIGVLLHHQGIEGIGVLLLFLVGYLILGSKILMEAARNIAKSQVFDENFLMSIATLGAFAIREYPEALGVMLFYRVGEYFEHKAVEKSRSQIMDAIDLRPETVNLMEGENVRVIPAENAQVGDVLLIRPGDRIPLDGIILEGNSRLDTSPITGEPVPVSVKVGDEIISGCVNTSGQLKMSVDKPLEESMVSRILDSVENAAASKPKIDKFITRFARVYTPFVVLAALTTAIIPSVFTGHWNYWVYTALTFLVMSCPCALVLSVPLAFFSGIGAGSKKGILFKGGVALEALTSIKAIVMDKTGTLTKGNFVVQKVQTADGQEADKLLLLTASCEQSSTHPIAVSIVTAAEEKGLKLLRPSVVKEIAGEGILAIIDGAVVLCGNRKLMDHHMVKLDAYTGDSFGTEVLIAVEGEYAGCLVISDTIKDDAKSAIAALKKQGLVTAMLTGDAKDSAEEVGAALGIDEVHAKLLPQDKLTRLQDIRSRHQNVMFVGDGINDAPVLAGADVGAAMGSGADAAIEAADVVFMTSSAQSIPDAVAIAKLTGKIAMQNVVFALVIKVAVMIFGLCGHANMWMAVFADTGVAMLCVLNSIRILYTKSHRA